MRSRKPKIAFLVPRYGIVDRGVENFTREFLFRLRDDFEITVFSRVKTTKETKKVFAIAESNRIINWFYGLFPWLREKLDKYFLNPLSIEMLTFSIFAFPYLLFDNYDLIFCQNGVWGAIACRIIRAIKKTPFVYKSAGGIEPPIIRQKPDIYFATNPAIYDFIRNYRPDVKVVPIPYGVDTEKFSLKVKPVKLNLERPIYLCVAALIPAKRIDLAIKAVGKLKRGSLLVLGDGTLRKELNKLGRRLLGKRFLLKKVPYEKIANFYAACDVFTLPSLAEPFGIVYLEALASGLPVVAPDDKSRRYIIGSAGILTEVNDLKKYSQALKKAVEFNFDNRPRRQAEKFNWKKIGKLYKKELKKLL